MLPALRMTTTFLILAMSVTAAQAHFIWLAPETSENGSTVQVYFGEDASPDDPDLLKYVTGMQAWQVRKGQAPAPLELARTDDSLSATISQEANESSLVIARHDLGVMNRGDAVFRLKYYAKANSTPNLAAWSEVDCSQELNLDVVPTVENGIVRINVRFNGQPAAGAQINASGPGLDEFAGETDQHGNASFPLAKSGRYSIRARQVEKASGEHKGKKYDEVRHYTTVTLDALSGLSPAAGGNLQPLEQPVTSFGAAILDGSVYIYGGHTGGAHSYSMKEQDQFIRRLDLQTGTWETLAKGPHLQGLALVPHGGKLYRIGGFTAKNAEGEEHDLWSQKDVAAYNPHTNQWTEMPSLPEPRSSFDAAVLGDTIYVIGGWHMAGEADAIWHKTAWAMDLSAATPEWKALPEPPFQRRALAVAAHNGKIYAIGGMQAKGGITTRVDIFDPETGTWSQGPSLVSQKPKSKTDSDDGQDPAASGRMTGFGASAFATGGQLYITTINGDLQRLSDDGSKWTIVTQTPTPRFFHRMLPVDSQHFVIVGGASMATGKFEEVEILKVN